MILNLFDWLETVDAKHNDRFANTTTSTWTYCQGPYWRYLIEDESAEKLHAGIWSSLPSSGWRRFGPGDGT